MSVGLGWLILSAYRPWLIAYRGRDTAKCPRALSAWHTGRLHAMQVGEPHRIAFLSSGCEQSDLHHFRVST